MRWLVLVVLSLFAVPAPAAAPAPDPDLGPNLALHRPVEASGQLWGAMTPVSLTDGDPSTFAHPLAPSGARGFYFQVDLGASLQLSEIRLRNRGDGCCAERLTRYRVEIYADEAGETGTLQWAANIRSDGTHSGVGGFDLVTRSNSPAGDFSGRFIRVVNVSNLGYNPQIAEIEAYGAPPPVIRFFTADPDAIASGQTAVLRWEIANATGAVLDPGAIPVTPAGSMAVSPAQTAVYTLTATNATAAAARSVTVGVDIRLSPPVITEFLSENRAGLKDEDRDTSDWIELLNPNPYTLDLGAFVLTDDPADPLQWPFPARKIAPGGRLVVFASGKDRRPEAGELHTNFRLDANGDYLALADSTGRILQQFPADFPASKTVPKQLPNVSYGLGSNGPPGFLRPPTPGLPNGVAFEGAVADTKFSPDRGFYTNSLLVAIQTATPGATIRYTTDRSDPTATHGTVYTGPIPVSRTTVLRAAAFRPGWSPTDIDTHTFIFLADVIAAPGMRTGITRNPSYAPKIAPGLLDLPSVSLNSPAAIGGTAETRSSVEWLTADPSLNFQENCGARNFGGAYTTFAKKNFRLYFRSEYGAPELRAPLFDPAPGQIAPVESFDQLELRGGSHDMVERGFYLSNLFADQTLLDFRQLNPHGRFVHLYLNGAYWGVYHLRERWNAAMHESYLGGARSDYESINGNWNVGGWAEPGTAYDGDGSAWARIKSLRDNYQAVQPLLDVAQYIDFMLVWMFGGSEDEYRAVGPTGPGSGFKFYLNDADGWFCGPWYCAADNRTVRSAPGRLNGDGPGSLFSMLFRQAHPDYRILLADRIHRAFFNDGPLTPAANIRRLGALSGGIERAFLAEAARWNYLSPSQWQGRRDYALTNWLPRRSAEALAHFRGAGFYPSLAAPVVSPQGGRVTPGFKLQFASPARGTVFYTLDGADPRLPGGALSASARTGPAILDENAIVKSRVRDGSQWSALNEAFFTTTGLPIAPAELVVAELNPDRSGAEFVELQNVSSRALDLTPVSLAGAIRFDFSTAAQTVLAPGARLLLVRDLFRFQQRYGLDLPVAGVYQGRLSPEGEDLLLATGASPLSLLPYRPDAPWPSLPPGHTLVLAHPGLGPASPTAWRPSVQPGGSPGGGDSVSFSGDPSADADRDGLSALLEYALATSDLDPSAGPGALAVSLDSGLVAASFPRNLAADDLLIRCDFSHDLERWRPATFLRSNLAAPSILREIWTAPADRNATFIRLVVRQK